MSSLVPYRVIKTLASVPAYSLSPVFILKVYVVDMAEEITNNKWKQILGPLKFNMMHPLL